MHCVMNYCDTTVHMQQGGMPAMPWLLYPMYADKSHIVDEVCSSAPQNDVAVEPHMSSLVHVQKDCGTMVRRDGPACERFGSL